MCIRDRTYVVLGYVGLRIGFHRYRGGKTPRMRRHLRRAAEAGILDDADLLMAEEGEMCIRDSRRIPPLPLG